MQKKELILSFYKIGLIKFGKFTFKSGIVSPNYVDCRVLISYPKILKVAAELIAEKLDAIEYDRMMGPPYTAIPLATAVSMINGKPFIFTRKEQKGYGTNKLIEGEFNKGEKIVIVDDVITNGGTKFEAAKPLRDLGLIVKNIVVIIDREQGGKEELEKGGLHLHSVFKLTDIFNILYKEGILNEDQYKENINSLKIRKNL